MTSLSYTQWGFVDRDDGQVELACNPETEATIFGSRERYGPLSTFERLSEVKAEIHIEPLATIDDLDGFVSSLAFSDAIGGSIYDWATTGQVARKELAENFVVLYPELYMGK